MSAIRMRRLRTPLVASGMLLASAPAYANVPLFAIFLTLPVTLIALVPVVVVEAILLARLLRLPMRQAISVSWWGNLFSTLVGVVVTSWWIVTEPMRMVLLKFLLPFFVASLLIEVAVAKPMLKSIATAALWRAALAANAVSYALLAVAIGTGLWSLEAQDARTMRQLLYDEIWALGDLRAEREAIEGHVATHASFPKSAEELGESWPDRSRRNEPGREESIYRQQHSKALRTKSIDLTRNGLRLTFSAPEFPQIDNASMKYSLSGSRSRAVAA